MRNRLGRIGHVVHGEQTVARILRDRNVRTHDKHGVGAFAVILKRCNSGGLPIHAVPIANGVLEIRGDARRVQGLIATLLGDKTLLTLPLQRHKDPATFA